MIKTSKYLKWNRLSVLLVWSLISCLGSSALLFGESLAQTEKANPRFDAAME
jgi:hypothetical protein